MALFCANLIHPWERLLWPKKFKIQLLIRHVLGLGHHKFHHLYALTQMKKILFTSLPTSTTSSQRQESQHLDQWLQQKPWCSNYTIMMIALYVLLRTQSHNSWRFYPLAKSPLNRFWRSTMKSWFWTQHTKPTNTNFYFLWLPELWPWTPPSMLLLPSWNQNTLQIMCG